MVINIFDCETTGKLHKDHRIIEASFRLVDLTTKEEKEKLFRFNPKRNIDAKAVAVHGITVKDLEHEPEFVEKAEEVLELIKAADMMVMHNGEFFDWPFLKQEFERVGLGDEVPEIKIFDTMIKGTFATDLGKSPTLYELCYSLGVVYDAQLAHSASYDTEVLKQAFLEGLRFGWFSL
jgi:DNA polymerase-3 subunit epsilon